jgi:hypothetical protein
MRIAALCTVFNEEKILPFFLSHYASWDEVHILIDRETTDESAEICSRFPNVKVKECGMTAGLHELEKVAMLEKEFHAIDADWIAVLDSDEFLVPPIKGVTTQGFLAELKDCECVPAKMLPVYRHLTDKDLDATKPAVPQRLHGNPSWTELKYCVLRPHVEHLTIGMHTLADPVTKLSPTHFLYSHWADADPSLSIARRMSRKVRFSKDNLKNGWGVQHHNVTPSKIMQELSEHMKDPLLTELADLV